MVAGNVDSDVIHVKELIGNKINTEGIFLNAAGISGDGSSGSWTSKGSMIMTDGKNISIGTSTGTKIGTGTSSKLAFWNSTPVVQQNAISNPTSDTSSNNTAIISILAVLRTIGVIAT